MPVDSLPERMQKAMQSPRRWKNNKSDMAKDSTDSEISRSHHFCNVVGIESSGVDHILRLERVAVCLDLVTAFLLLYIREPLWEQFTTPPPSF